MLANLILLPPGSNERMKELDEQNADIMPHTAIVDIHGKRCIHISSEGNKCTNLAAPNESNGWLCERHQAYISEAKRLHIMRVA